MWPEGIAVRGARRFILYPDRFSGIRDHVFTKRRCWAASCRQQYSVLGRIDDQEQIRGIRVEPAEVARVLCQYKDVAWCAILGSGTGQARELHAYILLKPQSSPTAACFRVFLAKLLPEAMIPSQFFSVPEIPLTSSGKLDKSRLVRSEWRTPLAQSAFRAPAGAVEVRIAAIVSGLFNGRVIGSDDNFFFLGGHSLLGAQAVMRIREAFGVGLTLRDIFMAPTIGQLATIVTQLLIERLESMTDEEVQMWGTD